MSIKSNIDQLRLSIPQHVKMVAVSKYHTQTEILEAYENGQRAFGESRVQELEAKYPDLPADIEWHFVGTLQRNKVKFIAPMVHLVHSLDSERLMRTIDLQAKAVNRVIPCLLQLHVAQETTKSGFTPDECRAFLKAGKWRNYNNVALAGVMGMATYTEDEQQVRNEFKLIKSLFDEFKTNFFLDDSRFKEISMGMSGDYSIAIEEGATIIRVGSLIFGER